MKKKIEKLILQALETLKSEGVLAQEITPNITIDRTRDPQHGDFASNLALMLAKSSNTSPRQLAEKLIASFPKDPAIVKVELAGPGFINFFIDPNCQYQIVKQIHDQGRKFGSSHVGVGKKIQVEFVSANPTGPLHVGHGRGAAYGSAVADLLEVAGFEVHRYSCYQYLAQIFGRMRRACAVPLQWLPRRIRA